MTVLILLPLFEVTQRVEHCFRQLTQAVCLSEQGRYTTVVACCAAASLALQSMRLEAEAAGFIWLDLPVESDLDDLIAVDNEHLPSHEYLLLLSATCEVSGLALERLGSHADTHDSPNALIPALAGPGTPFPWSITDDFPPQHYMAASTPPAARDEVEHCSSACLLIRQRYLQTLPAPKLTVCKIAEGGVWWDLESGHANAALNVCWTSVVAITSYPSQPIPPQIRRNTSTTNTQGEHRLALLLEAICKSGLPMIAHVLHGSGGGVERHVEELTRVMTGRACCLTIRPMHQAGGVLLTVGSSQAERLAYRLPDDEQALVDFLTGMGVALLHIHHTWGHSPHTWACLERLQVPTYITLHDYCILQGSPTLTGRQGTFIGHTQPVNAYEMSDIQQAKTLRLLTEQAERLIVPSEDMRERLTQALPTLHIETHAHPDKEYFGDYPVPAAPTLAPLEPLRVLCIGSLGREKGVETLKEVAELARLRRLPMEFILLGGSHIPLGEAVQVSGRYQEHQLAGLIQASKAHVAWFPVKWPETWSYTLSAALEAGLPIAAADIGAFPERLSGRPLTLLASHTSSAEQWIAVFERLHARLKLPDAALPWQQAPVSHFYRAGYLDAIEPRPAQSLSSHCYRGFILGTTALKTGGWRQALLYRLMRARHWPPIRGVLAYVPYNLQRRIKRLLSSSPLGQ